MRSRSILFALCVVLCSAGMANSTGEILGKVFVQETKEVLAFAEITFENRMDKITVTANEYGIYYVHRIPTGKYQMRIKHNNREFVLDKAPVYDGYSTEVNFPVSNDNTLPAVVVITLENKRLSSAESNNINLSGSTNHQPTRSLGDALSMQPGVDVSNGKLFIKGSDQVKFFIDGTPVLGQPQMGSTW